MIRTIHSTHRRLAFTLIELLVVIAIIAVLAGLLVVGVMKYMGKGPEIANRNDMLQLGTGLGKFYADYKFYPPDQIKLCANYTDYNPGANALDKMSLGYIGTMWPNLGKFTGMKWAGATTIPTTGIILEGDQCLVFFLGGPPNGGGAVGLMGGFAINPKDPVSLGATIDRKRYIDFDTARLVVRGGSPFPSMIDRYNKMPFVFFSSGRYGYVTPSNSLGAAPYMENASKFYNPTTYQLICAGEDGVFNTNGFAPPGQNIWSSSAPGAIPASGRDDTTNFYDKKMGL